MRDRRHGFTLTETMLAAAITSGAILTVLALLSSALGSARDSRIETGASILAVRLAAEAARLEPEEGSAVAREVGLFDAALQPINPGAADSAQIAEWHAKGAPQIAATYFTTVEKILPASPSWEPARVLVTVEAPASVAAGRRRIYRYVTLAAN